MVSLTDVLASNSQIPSILPKHLVAIFAGATSGIGEITLKTLIKYAVEPRIYLFARNATSAARVIAECRHINPDGEYIFIKVDLSSIRETDQACAEVVNREKQINLLVLSAGEARFDRGLTPEGLNTFLAASTYTRIRIAQRFLPLLSAATSSNSLARVIDVAAGTNEGDIDLSDLGAHKIPLTRLRPHLTSMHTLAWEELASQTPGVSFVHSYPGSVYTNLHKSATGALGWLFYIVLTFRYFFLWWWVLVPIEECGQRHVYLATRGRYKAKKGHAVCVPLGTQTTPSKGSDGVVGSGVYTVGWDGEGPTDRAEAALKELRSKRVGEVVWKHFLEQFERVAGSRSTSTA